jgi:cellobionic acid phosphorylase
VTRQFRGATFELDIRRGDVKDVTVMMGGKALPEQRVTGIKAGETYHLAVVVPL